MATREQILENIRRIEAEIARHARDPEKPPQLLPVTKMQPVESILALKEAGYTQIGENRVQEIMSKYPSLAQEFDIHLIGRLQTNKIKYIIGRVCMVQSVDRLSLAQAMDARAQAAGLQIPILIEVNIGGETQKAGITLEELEPFARSIAGLPGLSLRGLMTVMPVAPDAQQLRPLFQQMRGAYRGLQDLSIQNTRVDTLSMGMSGDWQIAAQEGSTILRIGSAIFGQRPPVSAVG